MNSSFRCSASSEEREESLVGSASTVRAFLLVEAPGTWGVNAVRDNRLPPPVKSAIAAEANRHGVRLLFIRRHGRRRRHGIHVFAAHADPADPWLESTVLKEPKSLLDLDLAGLGAGSSAGLPAHPSPVFAVCTHGRHDVCCAERGRPVAAALHRSRPEETWEVSHIGGDRFAGNVLVLPHGLYYGRLTADDAVALAERHHAGLLDLGHLRGRSGYPFPVQAAETYLRADLGRTGIHELPLVRHSGSGGETVAVFGDDARSWAVRVRTDRAAAVQLTCQSDRADRGLRHRLVSITPV